MKKNLFNLSLVGLLAVTGCGKKNTIDDKTIVVGASSVPHAEILNETKDYIVSKGYKLKVKIFDDYIIPNLALNDNELDANYFQHEPYLIEFCEERNLDLTSVLGVHFEPLGIYSNTKKPITSITQNSKIAITNDPTNQARALRLLAEKGLITLPVGETITVDDIKAENNPYQIDFKEVAPETIPTLLKDVDYGIINGNFALDHKITDKLVAKEENEELTNRYKNIIAVKTINQEKAAIKILVEAINRAKIKTFIEEKYNGAIVATF